MDHIITGLQNFLHLLPIVAFIQFLLISAPLVSSVRLVELCGVSDHGVLFCEFSYCMNVVDIAVFKVAVRVIVGVFDTTTLKHVSFSS
jgi:hypothetical protein